MIYFVEWLLNKFGGESRIDLLLKDACKAIRLFMTTILPASLWMTRVEARTVGLGGLHFLRVYGKVSYHCWNEGTCLYNLVPKLHMFHHLSLNVLQPLQQRGVQNILNPLSYSTFQDEDFIGRVCRLSRRINPRLQGLRTIQRYLVTTRQELDKLEKPE